MLSYLREKLGRILPCAMLMLALGGVCVVIAVAAEEPLMYAVAAADVLIGLFLLALTGRNALRDILLWRRLGCVEEALTDFRTAAREEGGVRLGRRFLFYNAGCAEYASIRAMYEGRDTMYHTNGEFTRYAVLYIETAGKPQPILQLNITRLPSEAWVDAVISRIMGAVAEKNPQVILRRPNL
ncbi:MAG: hypothetical protein IJ343_08100 [Clostridia bacterium]|nr:hypothetical protein [Clostridia bacterium]